MGTSVPLEELERAENELEALQMKDPDAYDEFAEFFQRHRKMGYKNISRMLMDEESPRKLKGLEDE